MHSIFITSVVSNLEKDNLASQPTCLDAHLWNAGPACVIQDACLFLDLVPIVVHCWEQHQLGNSRKSIRQRLLWAKLKKFEGSFLKDFLIVLSRIERALTDLTFKRVRVVDVNCTNNKQTRLKIFFKYK